ncbi:MAG: radical SAM/SPASM domain-containing protein [Methanobrevibacter sp.]|nr:radical SAM/SPASM domain-containing protein [Methanobrevibacter sp.]
MKKSLKNFLKKIGKKDNKTSKPKKEKSKAKRKLSEEEKWNNAVKKNDNASYEDIYNLINTFMQKDETPLFINIEIEIINRCNGTCSFCPVNKNADPRELTYMPDELYEKIINELDYLDYDGSIAFHSNNEPFLDKRLYKFVKYAREKLPNAYLYFFTNGTLLTLDKFKEIIEVLDMLIIDNYNDKKELIPPIKEVYDYILENPELKEKVYIDLRLQNQVLTSRGGEANNRKDVNLLKSSCLLPYTKIVVQPDGTVPLCCCDPFAKEVMGNANENTLEEIWNNEKFNAIREKLYQKEDSRKSIDLCKQCDALITEYDGTKYYINNIERKWRILEKAMNKNKE